MLLTNIQEQNLKGSIPFVRKHLLSICVICSLVIQISVFLLMFISTKIKKDDRQFIAVNINSYMNPPNRGKQDVKKEEKNAIPDPVSSDSNETKNTPLKESFSENKAGYGVDPYANYTTFVKVDDIAKPKTSLLPEYPEMARSAGVEGNVVLEVYIDEAGIVKKIKLVRGIGFGCDESAMHKVENTRFNPATMEGKPVAVKQIITFEFRLK